MLNSLRAILLRMLTGATTPVANPPEVSDNPLLIERARAAALSPNTVEDTFYDMDMSASMLAALFAIYGWQIDGASSNNGVPNSSEIMHLIHHNVMLVHDGEIDAYAARARFLAINNENYPGTTDIYLYVGETTNATHPSSEEDPFSELD